ncbi:enolase C-terminal domain-like protein [Gyrodon lividus]|nr:enolase C-terminal domain-like protein [Gyrodon lividus]
MSLAERRDRRQLSIAGPTTFALFGFNGCDHSSAYVTLYTQTEYSLVGHGMTFTIGRETDISTTPSKSSRLVNPRRGVCGVSGEKMRENRRRRCAWKKLGTSKLLLFSAVTTRITSSCGCPTNITSAGWLGYPYTKVAHLIKGAVEAGWTYSKMKVGASREDDLRGGTMIRGVVNDLGNYPADKVPRDPNSPGLSRKNAGPRGAELMVDANQVWVVDGVVEYVKALEEIRPFSLSLIQNGFLDEPTAPDDIPGHPSIRRSGKHAHNRMTFEQLFRAQVVDAIQINACKLGGVSEVLGMLMAAKFGALVCLHAGGLGNCEHVLHLSMDMYKASIAEYEWPNGT